jgi:hypothetical protein
MKKDDFWLVFIVMDGNLPLFKTRTGAPGCPLMSSGESPDQVPIPLAG